MSLKRYFIPQLLILIVISLTLLTNCSKSSSTTPTHPAPVVPMITSLSADSGSYLSSITIQGSDFSANSKNDQVYFNGIAATVVSASATNLVVTVPLAAGTGHVTLSVSGAATVTGPMFTYNLSTVETILAGSGTLGKANGQGTAASFNFPWGIVSDPTGNLYVVDDGSALIRKITPGGLVSTLAGGGTGTATDGQGATASFGFPTQIAIDASGNLYIADEIIRKITPVGLVRTPPAVGLAVTLFNGITVDAAGNIYLSESDANQLLKVTPTGTVSVFAGSGVEVTTDGTGSLASFNHPAGLTTDAAGNIYMVEQGGNTVRKITPGAVVSTITLSGSLGTLNAPEGIAVDAAGNLYIADTGNHLVKKVTPTGAISLVSAGVKQVISLMTPSGVTLDASGNIYIADRGNNVIVKIGQE